MAVIYTYCRRSKHDGYFFEDPTRMLGGRIETPRFNLHNEVMLRKHVHAAILSEMLRLCQQESAEERLSAFDLEEVQQARALAFPDYLVSYLFDEGLTYRQQPYDVSSLGIVMSKHQQHFLEVVQEVFAHYWPEADGYVVSPTALERYIQETPARLQEVIERLHGRLLWAVRVQERLLSMKSGESVTLEITRGADVQHVAVTLAPRPERPRLTGVDALRFFAGLDLVPQGDDRLVVASVVPGSELAHYKIAAGDVLQSILSKKDWLHGAKDNSRWRSVHTVSDLETRLETAYSDLDFYLGLRFKSKDGTKRELYLWEILSPTAAL